MHSVSVAQAKAHLSEILAKVAAGEELQITRRGRAVARLVPEPKAIDREPFDFDALAAFVDAQPLWHGNSVLSMREQDRY
jgi:prevent-host-death family protein